MMIMEVWNTPFMVSEGKISSHLALNLHLSERVHNASITTRLDSKRTPSD